MVATQEVLELNDLGDRAELAAGDLYELTRSEVEEFGPDLMVCCEVIEHVPDPELAVAALARALPDGVELLISVPLFGRLENVWGHVAIFTAERTRAMVEQAGLVAHNVSVVDNTWAFVLASTESRTQRKGCTRVSRGSRPHHRAGQSQRTSGVPGVRPGFPRHLSERMDQTRHQAGRPEHRRRPTVRVRGRAGGGSAGNSYGGVRFPATTPRGIRLELALDDIDAASAFYVDAMAGGTRVARWKWEPATGRPQSEPATFVLRSGRRGRYFRPVTCDDLESADAFDLFVALQAGASVRFRVTQAAVIV